MAHQSCCLNLKEEVVGDEEQAARGGVKMGSLHSETDLG